MQVHKTHTMVSTTNERFKYLEGSSNILFKDDKFNVYWFGNFHTSTVVKEKRTKNNVTITTRNSVYKFKENK